MKNLRILHLEDNPADAELIRIYIDEAFSDPDIKHVDNREEFILELKTGDFDLILSDLNVPKFLSTEALSLANEFLGMIPFIYVTGALGENVVIDVLKAGATDYVLKDNLEKLPYAIKRAYNEIKQKKENQKYLEQLYLKDNAIENASVGVLIIDPKANDTIIYTNKFISELTLFSEEELLGNNISILKGESTDEEIIKSIDAAIRNKTSFIGEIKYHRKDGSVFWSDLSISPVCDFNGVISNYVLIIKNITSQKELEQEIVSSNNLFEEIQNIAKIGLWNYDPESDMIFMSSIVAEILGEIKPFTCTLIEALKFFRPDYHTLFLNSIREGHLKQVKWDIDLLVVNKSGEEKWIRQIGYPVLIDNKVIVLRGLIMDNHAKKTAEIQAQKSSEFSDLIFNSVHDIICLHKPDGTYAKISPSIKKITGYSAEELIDKKPFDLIHPEDLESFTKNVLTPKIDDIYDNLQIEYRFLHKNGQYIWLLTNAAVLEGDTQETGQIVTSSVDITNLKLSGIELKREHKEALKYQCMLLSTQITPHFIFNSLNAVQYYILDQNIEPAIHFISNFSTLMRGVLANSMKNFIKIKDEINWLERYILLEKERFSNKFDYRIEIADQIDIEEDVIPTMLLQPFVENAIIHGIGALKSRGLVVLELKKENGIISCVIDDNGVGREQANQLKKLREEAPKHKSHGVSITRTKIELLNELEDGIFEYVVDDKLRSDGSSAGTRVVISYPDSIN